MSQKSTTVQPRTAIRMANAHNGWRSMNFVMSGHPHSIGAASRAGSQPASAGARRRAETFDAMSALVLPQREVGPHPPPSYRSVRPGLDRQYTFAQRGARSGPQNLCGAPIVRGRHANIAGEEVRECALRRKAEIEADIGDRRFGCHQ